jgi:4-amino-4-deoxychorismate lyase
MILVDGVARDEVSASDRGLGYGDGVFRTLLARRGLPVQWPRQYGKLAHDAAALGLRAPASDLLESEVRQVCRSEDDCAVKIILTRGVGVRGYAYTGAEKPTRIVFAGPLSQDLVTQRAEGIRVRLCTLKLSHQPALAGLKHLNRLENVLARAEWTDAEVAEGILCDAQGHVISGIMTNLFIAVDGALATPALEHCGVAGVTRERVMEEAERRRVCCSVTTLSWSDVLGADEVFLVNSLAGVLPVRDLDGEDRAPGPLARAAQRWLDEEDHA